MEADWNAVLRTWQTGDGDETVIEELGILIGVDSIASITQLLEGASTLWRNYHEHKRTSLDPTNGR